MRRAPRPPSRPTASDSALICLLRLVQEEFPKQRSHVCARARAPTTGAPVAACAAPRGAARLAARGEKHTLRSEEHLGRDLLAGARVTAGRHVLLSAVIVRGGGYTAGDENEHRREVDVLVEKPAQRVEPVRKRERDGANGTAVSVRLPNARRGGGLGARQARGERTSRRSTRRRA